MIPPQSVVPCGSAACVVPPPYPACLKRVQSSTMDHALPSLEFLGEGRRRFRVSDLGTVGGMGVPILITLPYPAANRFWAKSTR